ncbi:MAG: DegQ family serine endoprotease [Micavibrio sp.]|nr:DegQ family serine endoprotease [Micavibrio sp.]
MHKSVLHLTLALSLLLPGQAAFAQSPEESQKEAKAQAPNHGSFADMAEVLLPAVVNISSTIKMHPDEMQQMPGMQDMPQFPEGSPFEHFFEEFMNKRGAPGMPMEPEASLGSGFIIDAEKGLVITNNHVIRDAEEVRVTFHDDVTVDAEIIGRDEKTDIAVLKVKTDKKLRAVKFGNSDVMRVGDWVIAIGNPFGLGGTVTAGIVSARARDINAGPYDDFIQTDASINRGNSGGPMFNLNGEVIGINTAIFSPSGGSIGIGFAIPSSLAKPVINQIIKFGRTRRGWLGVRIQEVTKDIAESLGLPNENGALVASITEGGPSEKAGLKQGDVILELNGQEINEMRELPRLVAETPIDSNAEVTYWRDGKKLKASVNIGELEKAEEDGLLAEADTGMEMPGNSGTSINPPGITVTTLTDTVRGNYGISSDMKGVLITSIEPHSQAAEKGLYEGDIIIEANQKPLEKAKDLQAVIDAAKDDGRSSVLFLINREGDTRFIAVKIDDKD